MAQNCLPQIDIRLDKSIKGIQQIIHSVNSLNKRKSINYKRCDWLKRAAFQPYQNIDHFVKISYTNKTTLFKRRRANPIQNGYKGSLAPLQCHQTKKIMIINQSPRNQTQASLYDLRGCKSLLNQKGQNRKFVFDIDKREGQERKKYRYNRSLIEIGSVYDNTPLKGRRDIEQFAICPWNDKENENQKENKYGRHR